MSCACEHIRLSKELERVRRLAKSLAVMEGGTAAIYVKADGTYGFCAAGEENGNEIIEYITPY